MENEYFCKILLEPPNIDWVDIWKNNEVDHLSTSGSFQHHNNSRKWREIDDPLTLWSKEIIEKFQQIGIKPTTLRIFKWDPRHLFPWHTDGSYRHKTYCATNWILEGKGKIDFNKNIKIENDPEGMTSGKKIGSILDEVSVSTDGHQCLINTNLPHRVNNLRSNSTRISLSIVWKSIENKAITFEDLKSRFEKINLINS